MAADFKFIESACTPAVGTQNAQKRSVLNLFPNPASDRLILPENTGQIRVFDLEGNMILDKYASGDSTLDVSSLPSGLYFMELQTGTLWKSAKFVKLR